MENAVEIKYTAQNLDIPDNYSPETISELCVEVTSALERITKFYNLPMISYRIDFEGGKTSPKNMNLYVGFASYPHLSFYLESMNEWIDDAVSPFLNKKDGSYKMEYMRKLPLDVYMQYLSEN